ncbi:MAG: ABC transporter substrate-binding protein [Lachnospiraceae bacterium]|nr:ABC transporter substrate-binding protein [Lachnospiraceae bacterium]MDE7434345.1 ABC transporter substrate-binding protein [Lachnospiraceae bacterium]
MRKNIVALLVVMILSANLFYGCGSSSDLAVNKASTESAKSGDKKTVTIGYLPITHALAVFAEKELLDSEDGDITIKLEKFSSWSDLMDALNSGSIDGASVLIELAMGARSQGIDLKAVALGHKDGNVIVTSEEIQTAADLKGKTIAIPSTQSSHNILVQEALAGAGLTIDDINVVQLSPTEMPSSLASGSIDGYCVAEPFGAQAVSQGFGHVLYYSEDLWEDSFCCGLVLHESAIESLGSDAVNTLIEKYYEAGSSLHADDAQTIAESYLGQDEEVLQTSLQWIHYDDLEITPEGYQVLYDKVIEYGINDNPPTYEEFVYQAE